MSIRSVRIALFFLAVSADARAQTTFTPLADVPGGLASGRGLGIAPTGATVVGIGNDGSDLATAWSSAAGAWSAPAALPRLVANMIANARACNSAGSRAFGDANNASGIRQAVMWSLAGTPVLTPLGYPPAGGYSGTTYACSADGTVACGENLYQPTGVPPPLPITQAFRWTAAGMVDIGSLPGVPVGSGHLTTARAMSNDGNVIVGWADDASFATRPFRWTPAGGVVDISGGQWTGNARGCSPDGNIVVGSTSQTGVSVAFLWTQAGGREDLGTIGTFNGQAYNSSALLDAAQGACRACGLCLITTVAGTQLACIWEPATGWRSVKQVLVDAGINMSGWTLSFANAISDDGQTITGYGTNPSGQTQAWVARIPMPPPGDINADGSVDGRDIDSFVQLLGATTRASLCSADLNQDGSINAADVPAFVTLLLAP